MVTASKPSHQLFLGSRIWASASVGTPQDTDLPKPSMRLTDLPSSSYPNATKHVYIYIYTRGTWSPRVHIYIYMSVYASHLATWKVWDIPLHDAALLHVRDSLPPPRPAGPTGPKARRCPGNGSTTLGPKWALQERALNQTECYQRVTHRDDV